MSSKELTPIETDLLAKGLKFSVTSKTLLNKDIIATIEDAVKGLQNEESKCQSKPYTSKFKTSYG